MTNDKPVRIAILYPGDATARAAAAPDSSRFLPIFQALARLGAVVEPAVYHDDFADAVLAQLRALDGVLVWVNPNEGDRDRVRLDALLREVATHGVFVSTHPDIIDRLGTKAVLYETRNLSWGGRDTGLYTSAAMFREAMAAHHAAGRTRVIKQARGQSGNAVWKVEPDVGAAAMVRVLHAQRGAQPERIGLDELTARVRPYLDVGGRIIDQAYQARLPEGMVRCYLVQDRVAGFGHQAINALCPSAPGAAAPAPTPRLYYPPDLPRFRAIKHRMDSEWLPELTRTLTIDRTRLPIIWDCDFLLGAKEPDGQDGFVLCEINVSCVAPFPDSAIDLIASAALVRAKEARTLKLAKR